MTDLDTRAAAAGILTEYRDLFGEWRVTGAETKAALLSAMGLAEGAPPAPARTLPLLDRLRADGTRYVTRSVANHLNDRASGVCGARTAANTRGAAPCPRCRSAGTG